MLVPEDLLRRDHLLASGALATGLPGLRAAVGPKPGKFAHQWQRDERNPILLPGPGDFDSQGCFAPFVVCRDGEYFLFYAGVRKDSVRICVATAPVGRLTEWKRYGPILELGTAGAFDEVWQIYPCVHRVGNQWHLYYTGQSRRTGPQYFSAFWGIGLAMSDDLLHWKKYGTEPVVTGEGYPGFPDNKVIVGLGRILDVPQPDGRMLYRLYHTLPPALHNEDRTVTQRKFCVVAHSDDGIRWFDKRILFGPQPEVDYENIGVVGLTFWKSKARYRGLYTALGTRFGSMSYVMCEAASEDGLAWERPAGENLSLFPVQQGWDVTMAGYPCVIEEEDQIRLFYNGATLGATGIGTAMARKLE
ncbi:MAG: hypothetical protein FJW26_08190 [Acidimicrobiia bacterium]|nr:hypothetical protein [Acidimicrobiia bacterium]